MFSKPGAGPCIALHAPPTARDFFLANFYPYGQFREREREIGGWLGWWVGGWVGGWMEGWMDGCVDGWMCGWVFGWV